MGVQINLQHERQKCNIPKKNHEEKNKGGKKKKKKKKIDPDGTRTHNPQLRRLMPYPLGHRVLAQASGLYKRYLLYTTLFTAH